MTLRRKSFYFLKKQKKKAPSISAQCSLWCTSRDSNPGPTDQESKPPVRLNLWKFRVIVIFNQINVIFHPAISAPFVGFCSEKHPLHVLKPCKIRAEIVHLLPDKLKTTSSDNDLTALVRVTAHQKSSLGGYYYDEPAFLPLITFVNSVVSTACAVLLYLALRPALECTGLLTKAEAKQTPRPATPKAKSPTPAFPV